MTALVVLAVAVAIVLLIPSCVFLLESVSSLLAPRKRHLSRPDAVSAALLIPAHNEEAAIYDTVTAILPQLAPTDRLVVVADNCDDATASRAVRAGATVVERTDPSNRGKGYALAFGMNYLANDPPEILIVLDADCQLTAGSIDALVARASLTQRPVQADYVAAAADLGPLSMISFLAMLVRNRVRPRGLSRLGMPCTLTGSGMAFPWEVFCAAPSLGGELVEDLMMGIELALLGHEPTLCIEARVLSTLPRTREAATSQRRRWEHGQLRMQMRYGPKLLWIGVARRRLGLIVLGLDLLIPPIALLVIVQAIAVLLSTALFAVSGSSAALVLTAIGLVSVLLGTCLGWSHYGRSEVPFRYLLLVPIYLLWKVPLYAALAAGRGQRTWERTER
jgi:cellulose synthase/poly-beta-1,6-N-acetylglucosamine synthase-like glycosyltransferase